MKQLTLLITFVFGLVTINAQHKDCSDAFYVDEYKKYVFDTSEGHGLDSTEFSSLTCDDFGLEYNSTWLSFSTCDDGQVFFTITPELEGDIDFVVFRMPNAQDCASKVDIRCMYSGQTGGVDSERCLGATGLDTDEVDVYEGPGCAPGDNNFLAALDCEEGEHYLVAIINFSQSGENFEIEFFGTADLCAQSSTNNEQKEEALILFPNPTNEFLYLSQPYMPETTYSIFDLNGNYLKKGLLGAEQKVDVSAFANGIYILGIADTFERFVVLKE